VDCNPTYVVGPPVVLPQAVAIQKFGRCLRIMIMDLAVAKSVFCPGSLPVRHVALVSFFGR
jgi:hypothetical protein